MLPCLESCQGAAAGWRSIIPQSPYMHVAPATIPVIAEKTKAMESDQPQSSHRSRLCVSNESQGSTLAGPLNPSAFSLACSLPLDSPEGPRSSRTLDFSHYPLWSLSEFPCPVCCVFLPITKQCNLIYACGFSSLSEHQEPGQTVILPSGPLTVLHTCTVCRVSK